MKKIAQSIKNSPLLLNTMKMSASNIVMFLLPVVVTPILSRLYQPSDFGEWGVFSSFVAILTIAIFAGYENTIVKASEEEVPYVSALCLTLGVLVSAATLLVFGWGRNRGMAFFDHFPSVVLLLAYLLAYAAHTVASNLCNRYGQYTHLALESVVLGGSQAAFRVLFGLVAVSAFNGLILGTTLAQLATFLFLLVCLVRTGKLRSLWAFNIRRIGAIVSRYRNFALYDAPSSLLCYAGFSVPLLVLVGYFDKSTIGCYSIILQLLLLPMTLVGSAIGRVYYEQLCTNRGQLEHRLRCTRQVGKVVALIAFVPMLVLACGGDKLVVVFLGSKWVTAGNIALCLAFWSFPTILTQPLIPLFRFLNKQRVLFGYNLAYSLVAIGSIILGCELSHNLYHILTVYAVACSLVNLAMYFHILHLSGTGVAPFRRYMPLWVVSVAILAVRIALL